MRLEYPEVASNLGFPLRQFDGIILKGGHLLHRSSLWRKRRHIPQKHMGLIQLQPSMGNRESITSHTPRDFNVGRKNGVTGITHAGNHFPWRNVPNPIRISHYHGLQTLGFQQIIGDGMLLAVHSHETNKLLTVDHNPGLENILSRGIRNAIQSILQPSRGIINHGQHFDQLLTNCQLFQFGTTHIDMEYVRISDCGTLGNRFECTIGKGDRIGHDPFGRIHFN